MKQFAPLKLVGKNKDARRNTREQQTPLMRPLPPAVEARRLKLLDRAVRVEASRLKPKSVHHANLRATLVAEAPISFPVNGALGEALVKTQRTRQIGPTSISVEWLGSFGRVE